MDGRGEGCEPSRSVGRWIRMKGAERDGMLGRRAARALGGAETRGRTERLSEGRNEARACPMMPSLLIPRRIGEGGMGEEGEVPPFTKKPARKMPNL